MHYSEQLQMYTFIYNIGVTVCSECMVHLRDFDKIKEPFNRMSSHWPLSLAFLPTWQAKKEVHYKTGSGTAIWPSQAV